MVQSNGAGERNQRSRLSVRFYRSDAGAEPVRDWLGERSSVDRRVIGEDIKAVQFGWPLGLPWVRKLEPGLWEVRSVLAGGIARVVFTIVDGTMVLLHGFVKKAQAVPRRDLALARRRRARLLRRG